MIIAHRMSTLEMCDRLLVLEGGRWSRSASQPSSGPDNEFYRHALELSAVR